LMAGFAQVLPQTFLQKPAAEEWHDPERWAELLLPDHEPSFEHRAAQLRSSLLQRCSTR
jgi:hypothetical protein